MSNKAAFLFRVLVGGILCACLAFLPALDRNLVGDAASDGSGFSDDSPSSASGTGFVAILPASGVGMDILPVYQAATPGFMDLSGQGSCFSGKSRAPPSISAV